METNKNHIGLIIRQLAKEKNLSAIDLSKRMNISRQGVYDAFNQSNMSIEKIDQWANALEIESKDILDRLQGNVSKKQDNVSSDGYLMRYLAELEVTIKELRETVRSQAHTIEVLAGKSDNASLARLAASFFFGILATNLDAFIELSTQNSY